LECRLRDKSPADVATELRRIIEEGAKSEFGDWVRIQLRSSREMVTSTLESTPIADPNLLLKLVGFLQAVVRIEQNLFTPPQANEDVGDSTNE
jgi:hypothetical protein